MPPFAIDMTNNRLNRSSGRHSEKLDLGILMTIPEKMYAPTFLHKKILFVKKEVKTKKKKKTT